MTHTAAFEIKNANLHWLAFLAGLFPMGGAPLSSRIFPWTDSLDHFPILETQCDSDRARTFSMQILGLPILETFKKNHADARGQLDAWQTEVERENWKAPHDIKRRYSGADFLADNRVIFNIKGNAYRLVVRVRYQNGLVVVEWVGTHAEYGKKTF